MHRTEIAICFSPSADDRELGLTTSSCSMASAASSVPSTNVPCSPGPALLIAAAAHEGPRSIDKAVGPIACACAAATDSSPDQRDDADKPDDRASTIEPLASQFLDQRLRHDAFGDEARAVSVSQTSLP
jgi:hypothetical protein